MWCLLPYTDIKQPRVYIFPPVLNPPPHLPPHPIPLGCPSAPALSVLFHASILEWSSISHMVTYMFQCYSLKSFRPRLLPQSPRVCSLHLSLFCCRYHLSKFHIYASIYSIDAFLSNLPHAILFQLTRHSWLRKGCLTLTDLYYTLHLLLLYDFWF